MNKTIDYPYHTPGPWEISESPDFPGQQTIHAQGSDRILAVLDRTDEQDIANARLIAAAPDLLEALKEAIRLYDEGDATDVLEFIRCEARAALTKAEGQQSEVSA